MTAAVGLVTTVVGVALAVVAVVDAVTPAPLAGPRPGDTVALALATLALGAPLWGRTWRGLQAGWPPETSTSCGPPRAGCTCRACSV